MRPLNSGESSSLSPSRLHQWVRSLRERLYLIRVDGDRISDGAIGSFQNARPSSFNNNVEGDSDDIVVHSTQTCSTADLGPAPCCRCAASRNSLGEGWPPSSLVVVAVILRHAMFGRAAMTRSTRRSHASRERRCSETLAVHCVRAARVSDAGPRWTARLKPLVLPDAISQGGAPRVLLGSATGPPF